MILEARCGSDKWVGGGFSYRSLVSFAHSVVFEFPLLFSNLPPWPPLQKDTHMNMVEMASDVGHCFLRLVKHADLGR